MSHAKIPLTNCDEFLILDDEDVELLMGLTVSKSSEGYARCGRQYVHRVVMNAKRGESVDHINMNKLDCRKANLRIATKSQNLANRGPAKHNKSGFKGVYFCRQTGRYRAEIRFNNQRVKIGRFDTAEAAARAYDTAALEMHGEFARLNFTAPGDAGAIGRGCGE